MHNYTMKCWIIVIFSFAISFKHALAGKEKNVAFSPQADSALKMEFLKLEYAFFIAQTDNERYDALLQKIELSLLHNEHEKALQEINRIEDLNHEVLQVRMFYPFIEKQLLKAALYNSCLDVLNNDTLTAFTAEKSFIKALCLNQEKQLGPLKEEIKIACEKLHKDGSIILKSLQHYTYENSSKKSIILQSIVPGAGMINEAEFREGITSFLLNGIVITSAVLLLKQQFYASAISYGIFPWLKFYRGGIRHTRYLAEQNELKKISEIQQQNAELLYKFYSQ